MRKMASGDQCKQALVLGWLAGELIFTDDNLISFDWLNRTRSESLLSKVPIPEALISIIVSCFVLVVLNRTEKSLFRIAAGVGGLLYPLSFGIFHREAFGAYLMAPFCGLQFILGSLTGSLDAEFFADGTMCLAALGFWQFFCLVAIFYKTSTINSSVYTEAMHVTAP